MTSISYNFKAEVAQIGAWGFLGDLRANLGGMMMTSFASLGRSSRGAGSVFKSIRP